MVLSCKEPLKRFSLRSLGDAFPLEAVLTAVEMKGKLQQPCSHPM